MHCAKCGLLGGYVPRSEITPAPLGSTGFDRREIGTNLCLPQLWLRYRWGLYTPGRHQRLRPISSWGSLRDRTGTTLWDFVLPQSSRIGPCVTIAKLLNDRISIVLLDGVAEVIFDGWSSLFRHVTRIAWARVIRVIVLRYNIAARRFQARMELLRLTGNALCLGRFLWFAVSVLRFVPWMVDLSPSFSQPSGLRRRCWSGQCLP